MTTKYLGICALLCLSTTLFSQNFTISIGPYPKPHPNAYFTDIGFKDLVTIQRQKNGDYTYHLGSFMTYFEAELKLPQIKQRWTTASIVDLQEAAELAAFPCPYELESIDGALKTYYLHFDGKSLQLREDAKAILREINEIVAANADLRIKITGHTDGEGEGPDNRELSRERARTTRDYLIDKLKVSFKRIDSSGSGEAEPLLPNDDAPNCPNARNRAINNRVTVTLYL
jgi:outer membrane protein OmpA-like peptidoglycan-associated protein